MADYYLSASSGSDSTGDGSIGNPWRTYIAHFSGKYALSPGDSVNWLCNDIWIGKDADVLVQSSGSQVSPINLRAYGTGSLPTLTGDSATTLGWIATGISNIYALTGQSQTIRTVTMLDTMALGLWRGTTANLPEGTSIRNNNILYVRLYGNSDPSVSNTRVGNYTATGGINRGLLRIASSGIYVNVTSMRVCEINHVGISASGSNNAFYDCEVMGAGKDGVLSVSFLPANEHAENFRWWRGKVSWSAAGGTGNGQGVTIGTRSSWIVSAQVFDCYMAGIDFLDYSDVDTDVRYSGAAWNIVTHCGRWQDSGGFDPGIYASDGASFIYIYGNQVFETGSGPTTSLTARNGIQWGSEHPDIRPCHDVYIINNLVYNSYWRGVCPNNAQDNTSNVLNSWVINNTIVTALNMSSANQGYGLNEVYPSTGNFVFKNNVVYCGNASQMVNNNINTTGVLDADYNVFFRDGSLLLFSQNGGGNGLTLGSWQLISGQDSHSIQQDPLLVSVSIAGVANVRCRASSSPIIAAGATGVFTVPSWLPSDVFPFGGAVRGTTRTDNSFDTGTTSIDAGFHYLSDQAAPQTTVYSRLTIASAKVTVDRNAKLQLVS